MKTKVKDFSGRVQVGTSVLWYPHANINNTPVPAVVHEAFDNGTATLCLITLEGIQGKRSVYHVSNKMLCHQDSGQPTPNALKNGGWDFLPEPAKAEVKAEVVEPEPEGELKAELKTKKK